MNKKITKTIYLIVFVVFMQLFCENVYANTGKTALTCEYGYSKGKIAIAIDNNGGAELTDDTYISAGIGQEVSNWDDKVGDFKGRDYFLQTYDCPGWGLVEVNTGLPDYLYVFDTKEKAEAYKKKKNFGGNDVVVQLTNKIISDDAREELLSNSNKPKKISLPKKCHCEATVNGVPLSADFTINDINKSPNVTMKHGEVTDDSENIINWSSSESGYSYYYTADLNENDRCPEKLLLKYEKNVFMWFDNVDIYVSDSASASVIRQKVGASVTDILDCKQTNIVNPGSNSNSNPGSKSNSNSDIILSNPNVEISNIGPIERDMKTFSCGDGYLTGIPQSIPALGKIITNFIQILVPIIIIILGSIDLVKALSSQKEDDIKKGQQTFFKRLLSAILVFFVFAIAKLAISLVATNTEGLFNCVDCIIKNNSSCVEE